jgi:hypothetical protein
MVNDIAGFLSWLGFVIGLLGALTVFRMASYSGLVGVPSFLSFYSE